jgi:NADPH-dependent 2,4-dienoyl-CoA reductase/sulfur reductase-like enzyme
MSDDALHFDVAIVGAGPAGIAAACAAAECGKRVAVIDDTPWLGGQIWRGEKAPFQKGQARRWLEKFRRANVTLLDQTSVVAAPAPNCLLAEHPSGPRTIHYGKLILATGARELFLPFPGWTNPGVFGPGGLQVLVKNGWAVRGKKVVVAGTGPLLMAVAQGLKKHGAEIVLIADQAPFARVAGFGMRLLAHPGKILQGIQLKAGLAGVPSKFGTWPVRADGDGSIQSVTLTDGRNTWVEACDILACGFHLVPNVELPLALGCALDGAFVKVDASQMTTIAGVYCAGEPTGVGGVDCALVEGEIAGYAAGGMPAKAASLFSRRKLWHRFREQLAHAFALRDELKTVAADDTLLCRCEDVPLGRVRPHANWREAKLHTRCGMGPCQGRVCGGAAKFLLGMGMESVRPPIYPVRVSTFVTISSATANTNPTSQSS